MTVSVEPTSFALAITNEKAFLQWLGARDAALGAKLRDQHEEASATQPDGQYEKKNWLCLVLCLASAGLVG